MQTWRATGSQGGYQADGRTVGSDLVDRKREGSLSEGAPVAAAFLLPQRTHTHANKHTLGDTNNS